MPTASSGPFDFAISGKHSLLFTPGQAREAAVTMSEFQIGK